MHGATFPLRLARIRCLQGPPGPEPFVGTPEHDFQLLTSCQDSSEAALIRALLDANGIPCIVQGEQHRSMLGVVGAFVEVRVLVPAGQLEHARELLQEPPPEELPGSVTDATPSPDSEDAHCAVHGQRATRSCERCGTFLCSRCEEARTGLCEDCAERKGAGDQVRRGRTRKVVAWLILAFMVGPLFLIMLLGVLARLGP